MKAPPEIIYTGLRRTLGSPSDISANKANGNFNTGSVDLKIPIQETDQKREHKVDGGNQDDGYGNMEA